MEKIASFTVDHERLLRGIYVSRRDLTPSGDILTTFDVRMTEPNRHPALSGAALHTIEHLAATYLRNRPDWKDRVVYWGPMGCRTGNYLILSGDLKPGDIVELIRDTFRFIAEYEGEVPGASPRVAATIHIWISMRPKRRPGVFSTKCCFGLSGKTLNIRSELSPAADRC